MKKRLTKKKKSNVGKLKIGDDWNAITIIALSQSNPLKAVAEFVENSIDAGAENVTVTRGKEKGQAYLRIRDDGEGIRRNEKGFPDFQYVATHICDSIKRQLKEKGAEGIQGEYGIGLLSFWTVGEELTLTSSGADGGTYRMHMRKGDPEFSISRKAVLFQDRGTDLLIRPILSGIKQLSGEKIQWYLASELRDRIRKSGVQIRVIDRTARTEFKVEPRAYEGQLLHNLSKFLPSQSEVYLEVYLGKHDPGFGVSLCRKGTRVLDKISDLSPFQSPVWNSGYFQGIVDAPYLQLTPGTRMGVIQDASFERLIQELRPVEAQLKAILEAQQKAEEEQTSRDVLKTIQKALKEALLALPTEEYDWFQLKRTDPQSKSGGKGSGGRRDDEKGDEEEARPENDVIMDEPDPGKPSVPFQKQFFEYAGPLYSVKISPAASVVRVNESRNFSAVARDRTHNRVEKDLVFQWDIPEGQGRLENADGEITTFHAPAEPGLIRLKLKAEQSGATCEAEALVTVTDSLLPERGPRESNSRGIPGYTYLKSPGELWRSRFDDDNNLVVINNGHRDFVYASGSKAQKLRYVCRLFAKELVLKNFVGLPVDQLLERLIELTLYTESHLK